MINLPEDEFKKNLLIAAVACVTFYLFMIRSIFLFIPLFVLILYGLWKKNGGRFESWEDDDPADWWKKGKRWGGWQER